MSPHQFTPKSAATAPQKPVYEVTATTDSVGVFLITTMRVAVVALGFLLPIFFWPGLWGTLGFQKSILAVGLVAVVVLAGSFLALRTKATATVLPIPLLLFSLFVVAACMSGVTSADPLTALRGSTFGVQTVAFMAVMLLVMSVPLVLQYSKRYVFYICTAIGAGLLTLITYVSVRFLLGPVLPFNSFFGTVQSPAGNLNDVAVLAGLTIILSLITLLQLTLRRITQIVLATLIGLSVVIMAVVNFFYVWLVVGFFSLLILLYLLSYKHLFDDAATAKLTAPKLLVIILAVIISLTSAGFIIAGDYVGQVVSEQFDIEYLEIRPSLQSTFAITRGVYAEQPLLGVGANQFELAWRTHKDEAINQTVFWNTDFTAGSGYVPTLFITLGLLGGGLFILFQLWYAWVGLKNLLRPTVTDAFWYYAGLFSFTGSIMLWLLAYVYVPSASVLLLAAFLTGMSFVAFSDLRPQSRLVIPLMINHKRGFLLMAAVLLVITATIYSLFTMGEQYVAQSSFNQVQQSTAEVASIDQAARRAYSLYSDHRFLGIRAQAALLEMNRLLVIAEPTTVEQQQFAAAADQAVRFTNEAIQASPQNPAYRALLARIYNNFALAGVPGAVERVDTALREAEQRDPKNPLYALMAGQMAAARGDAVAARVGVEQAIAQKRNFTEALFLLAQLDIADQDVPAAIAATQTILTLEPQNPARYYQLAILYVANGQTNEALAAYQMALDIDPEFANARYLRALLLIDRGETELALADIRIVAATNPDNAAVQQLLSALESGDAATIEELQTSDNAVPFAGTSEVSGSNLVTPLNTAPVQTTEPGSATVTELPAETGQPAAVESDEQ